MSDHFDKQESAVDPIPISEAASLPDPQESALFDLLIHLKTSGYRFTSVTPATHERVLARKTQSKPTLRDIFGWNRPFAVEDVEPGTLALMQQAGMLRTGHVGY